MTASTHVHTVGGDPSPLPRMTIGLPEGWQQIEAEGLTAFGDGRSLSPAIESNMVFSSVTLEPDVTLEGWRAVVRASQLGTLPDLQIFDDRAVVASDGTPQWYSSAVMTDPHGVTVLTRHWCRKLGTTGVTLTLTTVPLVDAEHAETFDDIAESWETPS